MRTVISLIKKLLKFSDLFLSNPFMPQKQNLLVKKMLTSEANQQIELTGAAATVLDSTAKTRAAA